jgi:predicted RNA-binding protein YlxR (DUF448 family)
MVKIRKIPERQCLGCRTHKPKSELIRIVRSPDLTEVTLDFKGKMNGRGAYICPKPECLKRVRKTGVVGRQLGIAIPPEVWDALEKSIEQSQQT